MFCSTKNLNCIYSDFKSSLTTKDSEVTDTPELFKSLVLVKPDIYPTLQYKTETNNRFLNVTALSLSGVH